MLHLLLNVQHGLILLSFREVSGCSRLESSGLQKLLVIEDGLVNDLDCLELLLLWLLLLLLLSDRFSQ